MPREAPYRLSLTEYEESPSALHEIAERLTITSQAAATLLQKASERITRQLRLRSAPIIVQGETVRVEGVAGLVRISPRLELEVAPKFLGRTWDQWRSDFFVVATLTRFGALLPFDRLLAGFGERGDLASLVARAMIEEHRLNYRRPLRTYRRLAVRDFAIEGDIPPEEFVIRDPDGYEQSRMILARTNPYNAVIHQAADELLPEVSDTQTRQQLLRVRGSLAPQQPVRGQRPRWVPNRHRRWQPLYELSGQVVDGFGVDLAEAVHALAPGYVMRTADAWEELTTTALRLGVSNEHVSIHEGFTLGTRNGKPFETTPDAVIRHQAGLVLVDAKYKSRVGEQAKAISSADVYEGLAFLRASGATKLALLYPRPASEGTVQPDTGETILFETVEVGDFRILGYTVEARGLARRDGFRQFSAKIASSISAL